MNNQTANRGRTGKLFVVSGPSGVGKDVILEKVFARFGGTIARSVSATTRAPRPGETDGTDYHFCSRTEFQELADGGHFLEYAEYGPNLYGTPKSSADALRSHGIDVVLKIEVQGARQIRRIAPDAMLIFIQPPSVEELERRLRGRSTEPDALIQERLAIAIGEIAQASTYDYIVTNDNLDDAVDVVSAIIVAERHRVVHAEDLIA